MNGLEGFSVRGLRRFQTILLASGLLLFPTVLLIDSTLLYAVSTLVFITLFLGFRNAELLIGLKLKQRQESHSEALRRLVSECTHLFAELTAIFQEKGYSIRLEDNAMLQNTSFYFDKCTSVSDYMELKNVLQGRIAFVMKLQSNKEDDGKSERIAHPHRSSVSRHFTTLGIPDGTTDMVKIKKAYKALIKASHPDVNKDKDAHSWTTELNLAYEKIKKYVNAS